LKVPTDSQHLVLESFQRYIQRYPHV